MELLHEVAGRFHRAACCEQIVVEQHDIIALNGVFVNLYRVSSVLFLVGLLHGVARQLSWFAAQHDSGTQS